MDEETMNGITFGTLTRDGTLTNIRVINHSDIAGCPRSIMVPEHYKANGTCLCKDPDEIARILAERQIGRVKYENIIAKQAAMRRKGRKYHDGNYQRPQDTLQDPRYLPRMRREIQKGRDEDNH
jgi:hypothetical protein